MKAFEEKQTLLRRITTLKQKNEIVMNAWQLWIIGQVEQLRIQEQRLLENQAQNKEGPMVQQIRSYKALEIENNKAKDVEPIMGAKDKAKQKQIGVKIRELAKIFQIHDSMLPSNIELEKKRKEKETFAKKLEIVENEAAIAEMNNKIKFLENAKKQSISLPESNANDKSKNENQAIAGLSTSPLVSSSQRTNPN